jgi:osmotically-inducible protein OsmY
MEEHMRTSIFLGVIAMAMIAVACNSQAVDDASITAKVKGRLAADSQTSAIKIGVGTSGGEVTLTGTVPTDKEKARAQQIAANEAGVKKVVNNINVDPNSIGATNAGEKVEEAKKEVSKTAADDLILGKIKSKLLVAGLSSVAVNVDNGQVVLTGKVKSTEEKTEAEAIAKDTDGVKGVKDELNIQAA